MESATFTEAGQWSSAMAEQPDQFDSQEFYELMQAYRWSELTYPSQTVAAFEAVKAFCRRVASEVEQSRHG